MLWFCDLEIFIIGFVIGIVLIILRVVTVIVVSRGYCEGSCFYFIVEMGYEAK